MRSFTIISVKKLQGTRVNYTGGRFIGEAPNTVVRKVFSKVNSYLNSKSGLSLIIKIQETTRGSLHKEYVYKVTKKSEHVEVERDGKMITYNFITKVKSKN